MIINSLDLGAASNPYLKPSDSQVRGEAMVEGFGTFAYPRGSSLQEIPVEFWVRAWQTLGGNAAGTMVAGQLLVKQLEELTNNPRLNPAYVRWNATEEPGGYNATDPHDGWWLIESFQPDYSMFVISGWVKCSMKVTFIAEGPPANASLWYAGGALASDASGAAKNLLTQDGIGGTNFAWGQATPFARTGAEGNLDNVLAPIPNPYPFVFGSAIADWFRGGVHVYDTVNFGAYPVPAGPGTGFNLLSQAGFESPNSDWILGGAGSGTAAIDGVAPRTGSLSLHLTNPSAGNYGTAYNKRGALVAGLKTINISAYIKTTGAGAATGPLRVCFANPGTNVGTDGIATAQPSAQAGITAFDLNPVITTGYVQYSQNISVPTGYSWMFVELYANGNGTASPVYYDDLVLQDAARNTGWVEVFDTNHRFVGDCIISNGLLLFLFRTGDNDVFTAWLWNTALAIPAWQQVGSVVQGDNSFTGATTRQYSLRRVGAHECSIEVVGASSGGQAGTTFVRLQKGRYEARIDFQPKTEAPNNGFQLLFSSAASVNVKIAYNQASIRDAVTEPNTTVAPTTDYLYGGIFPADSTRPWIVGFLYQNQAITAQPQVTGAGYQVSIGDRLTFPVNSRRSYGFFVIPYGVSGSYSTANLQKEGESGGLGTGWSSVADAAASAGNTAKCASGTLVNNALDQVPADVVRSPGAYRAWFRVRVASAASGTVQMRFVVYDTTSATELLNSGALAPNAFGTTYGWYSPGTFSIPASHQLHGFVQTVTNTTNTDWFVDEVVFVPLTLADDNRGPQDIWQQFMYDRDVEMIVT